MAKGEMPAYHESMRKLCGQIEKYLAEHGRQDGTLDESASLSDILGEKLEKYWDKWKIAIILAFTIQHLYSAGGTTGFDAETLEWALAMRVTKHSFDVPEAFTVHAANTLHLNALAGLAKAAMRDESDIRQGVMYKTREDVERWAKNPEESLKVRKK